MAKRDAIADAKSPIAVQQSAVMTQRENMVLLPFTLQDFTQDANISRPPDYHIYVYNIAPRRFEIRRPPNFPCIVFGPCPKGQEYVKVGVFPNIVNEKWVDADTGETRNRGIQGERFVMDLLNPVSLGIDMWNAPVSQDRAWLDQGTDDATRRGLFFSTDDPPKPEHIRITRERMEAHYKTLLQQADQAYMSNEVDQRRTIGPEHHMAAEYFHAKSAWHIIAEIQPQCPNCGEFIAKDVAFHRNTLGFICVLDWHRAVKAGAIKREDVPVECRWWDEKEVRK